MFKRKHGSTTGDKLAHAELNSDESPLNRCMAAQPQERIAPQGTPDSREMQSSTWRLDNSSYHQPLS